MISEIGKDRRVLEGRNISDVVSIDRPRGSISQRRLTRTEHVSNLGLWTAPDFWWELIFALRGGFLCPVWLCWWSGVREKLCIGLSRHCVREQERKRLYDCYS